MALSVIGGGFGRTGTHTLNLALEMLGFGPCHHMEDVNSNPEHRDLIRAAGRGEPVDWDLVYLGYKSAVDWPTAYFWRELAEYFPDAKLILTVRNPEDWYRSARATIFNTMGETSDPQSFGRVVIETKIFGGRLDDETHAIEVLAAHNAEVVSAFPPSRLLVYQVAEGWPNLCAFLSVPIPAETFPHSNTTTEFRSRFAK
ncbi:MULTISPECIES: sulfotransferase family protein [unclassified Mesorhizobium]|uniref:sulfotransferase family protein n=1 Tax=unclassified Mesorhizobium TaxID=325217 RepID=UPI0011288816|nr:MULTISPECIES: sulfotransferase family protein [unclassified Mesorhizobium]TPM07434.1 sulfotransferase [Mesorhizobium sp. B2-3-8]TPM16144.1 sulfotransferase [Mesorhizobium sp. B2-3-7]